MRSARGGSAGVAERGALGLWHDGDGVTQLGNSYHVPVMPIARAHPGTAGMRAERAFLGLNSAPRIG